MKEEIIIDGEHLDLDYDFKGVQLVFQSPYLTELRSVVSNRSNSISVPATDRNRRLLGYAGTQAESLFPYRRHSVIYRREGVEMLRGTATLLSTGRDTLTLCFTWGNREALQLLFDTKLRDLASFTVGGVTYSEEYIYYDYSRNPTRFPYYVMCGHGLRQPALRVSDILARMEAACGVTGLVSVLAWKGLGLLLPTRNGDTHTREVQGITLGTPGSSTWEHEYLHDITTLTKGTGATDYHQSMNGSGIIDVTEALSLRVMLSGTFESAQYATTYGDPALRVLGRDENGWNFIDTLATPTWNPGVLMAPFEVLPNCYPSGGVNAHISTISNNQYEAWKYSVQENEVYYVSLDTGLKNLYHLRFVNSNGVIISRDLANGGTPTNYTNVAFTAPAGAVELWLSVRKTYSDSYKVRQKVGNAVYSYSVNSDKTYDVAAYEAVCLCIMQDIGIYPSTLYNVSLSSRMVLDPGEGEDVMQGIAEQNYPLWHNLPDMTCGDFIKALMLPFCMFAYSDTPGTIRFTDFAELYANRSRAVVWTDKMIDQVPRDRTTVLDGFACRNLMKWKADEGVPSGVLDGVIICDDENLQAEAVAYESPLTLPYGNEVPVWTFDENDELTFLGDDRVPRLLRHLYNATPSDVWGMQYDPRLAWPALLDAYYTGYRRTVLHPVVLKVDVLLSTADINGLDLRVPVYLAQTGHYYAIRKLTTKNAKEAEAELIELK